MPRVDFHTHSSCSDGVLDPERLAGYLASRGARYAALTDHDTGAGLAIFRAALARRGVGCIDGVEFTARSPFGELHILAYSAGPIRPELAALLPPYTGGRWGAGLAGMGSLPEREGAANSSRPGVPVASRGPAVPQAVNLIAGIHGCGAASYLAHPFTVSRDPATLGRLLDELIPAGLDGIEAIYGAYTEAERATLLELASSSGLAVSAGSDLHEPGSGGPRGVVEMDDRQWRDFRDSIFSRPDTAAGSRSTPGSTAEAAAGKPRVSKPLSRGASGPARVAIPALAVITLFVVSMFAIVIPQVHGMLLEHKKETIQGIAESVEELASCSVAILDHVRAMDAAGGKARHIVRLLTEVHDLTVRKLVDLSLLRSGEAPCAWAFVVLGSAGRGELLPGSDQDNAIIFDPASGNGDAERPWFLGLGEYLCDSLERTGIPKCRHGLMARNPDWCAPRAEWEARYAHWVEEPESGRIVNLNALIDIRPVAGSSDLVASIRGSFESAVARTPSFLVHLANSARNLRIPGAPMVDPAGAKEAAGLFPAFVRVYATKAGLRQTNTFARLDALAAAGILWDDTARESTESYEILLKNRLALGLGASGKPGRILETMTKVALSQAVVLQKRIGFDFPGLPA